MKNLVPTCFVIDNFSITRVIAFGINVNTIIK